MPAPDFDNLLAVLHRERPARPTLFEFFLNDRLYRNLAGYDPVPTVLGRARWIMDAYRQAGYDYVTLPGTDFRFPAGPHRSAASISQNEGAVIADRASFEAYAWPSPDVFATDRLDKLAADLPAGMKIVVYGPGGVLENVINLVGYEPLCYLVADDPKLADDLFAAVGSRLVRYYEQCAPHATVGALIGNDDWGHKTQTMLPPELMRRFVFPWHARIVEAIHAAGKPAILHSCGNRREILDDIVDVCRYDGLHSYEDLIQPVEEAYAAHGSRIAILGGIDVDFLCRSTPAEIDARAKAMLARAADRGGYALGSGNSIPYYVPDESYFALIGAAR